MDAHDLDMDVMYYENTRTHGRIVLMYACRLLAVGSVVFCWWPALSKVK